MHTVIVLGAGLSAFVSCLLLGHAWGHWPGVREGARLFIPLWFCGAFINMWVGTRHGYSWGQEFPIFLVIFIAPALVAGLVWWKLS